MRRRVSKRATAALAVLVLAVATAAMVGVVRQQRVGAAPGPAPATGTQLLASHSGKCLNVAKASTADKAPVVQYRCVGAANERWRAVPQDDGSYQLVAEHSGKCLNVSGGATGNSAPLVQYRCVGAPNERWTPLQRPDGNSFTLVAQHSGKCLNVAGASTADGAAIVQYDCIASARNEIWSGGPQRNADAPAAGPTVGLQTAPGGALHLAYVDAEGRGWYGATFPESGSITWSALPGGQSFIQRPELLPAGTGVQVLARSIYSDVFGVLPPGRARWTDTGGPVQSDPSRGNGLVMATGWDNGLWMAPDDGVHVPFLAWRKVAGSRLDLTGRPVVVPAATGQTVFVSDLTGTIRSAVLSEGQLSGWQVVGAGVDQLSVAVLPGYRYVVASYSGGGQVSVKVQNADRTWPADWTVLPSETTMSYAPQLILNPSGRLSVVALDGELQQVKAATETAAGSGTFGAWQAVPAPEPVVTAPEVFTYQGLEGSETWGFVVRTADDETLLFLASSGATAASGFAVEKLPAPRR